MKMQNTALRNLLAIGFVVACGSAFAEGGKIAGSAALSYTKQEASIPPVEGHLLALGEVAGTNKGIDGSGYMDGASVMNREIVQLYQGNGFHSGYYTMTKDDSATTALWKGEVTTVMKDNVPNTSFKGTWEYVNGTGKYAGIKGKGKYSGYFTSQTSYVVDWSGDYVVK